jgi:hypothetical protein
LPKLLKVKDVHVAVDLCTWPSKCWPKEDPGIESVSSVLPARNVWIRSIVAKVLTKTFTVKYATARSLDPRVMDTDKEQEPFKAIPLIMGMLVLLVLPSVIRVL